MSEDGRTNTGKGIKIAKAIYEIAYRRTIHEYSLQSISLRIGRGIWKQLLCLEYSLVVLLGIGFMLLMCFEVYSRYFVDTPVLWIEEVILYALFWYYIIGAAHATYKRSNISGGIVQSIVKNPQYLKYWEFGCAIISFGVSCLFGVWGYQHFKWALGVGPKTMMLDLPLQYSELSLFVGFVLISLYLLAELVDRARHLRRDVEKC